MRKVGLVGGYYPRVAVSYHRRIVQVARERMGEGVRPEVVLESAAWPDIDTLCAPGGVDELRTCAKDVVGRLEASGCELIASGCDVDALAFNLVRQSVTATLTCAVEAVLREVTRKGYRRVILLGNSATCVLPSLKAPLAKAGVMVFTPGERDRRWLDQVIADELERGCVCEETAGRFAMMLHDGVEHDVDAIVLGRTELGVLVERGNPRIDVLDAQALHVEAIVSAMMDDAEERNRSI